MPYETMETDQHADPEPDTERGRTPMKIRLFGGVSIDDDAGEPIDPGPAKCQELLAALALDADSAVPVTTLVDLLWRDDPPRTAEKTLQTYVARLRKAVGYETITRVGAAYRLELPAESIDVKRFQQHLARGDIRSALDEWVGIPLAGLDAEGLAPTVDGLIEQWLGAVEIDLEHTVERDPNAAVGALTELTASHPFREGLWALLMTALYKGGRQAEALDAYRRARAHLVEELGVEPGPRLRELESLILTHDARLDAGVRSSGSPVTIPTGTVTFGFSDVQGSTQLWAEQREQTSAAIARHDELVRLAATDHDGYVFATGGDSFGVAFDRVSDATSWAAQVHRSLAEEPWPSGIGVCVRIGIHTGDAEERSDNYYGPAVTIAARLAAAGHGGQTLLSEVSAALFDGHQLLDLGMFRPDGMGAEQHIHQLGAGDFPPLRTGHDRRSTLPRPAGRLIGRADIVTAGVDALARSPIVTFVGPGGIGKTRLALEVGRIVESETSGGIWFVELADVAASPDVARALADALSVKETPDRTLLESIVSFLRTRRALVVLDNCEHVIDGAAAVAGAVSTQCEDVTILATSREGLGLPGEQLLAIGPLAADDAGVELFNERAAAADRTFDPTEHRGSVEEICRRLDGVPLAIELAAARIRSHSPTDLIERLDDSFRLLTAGRRTHVERHRTLRATVPVVLRPADVIGAATVPSSGGLRRIIRSARRRDGGVRLRARHRRRRGAARRPGRSVDGDGRVGNVGSTVPAPRDDAPIRCRDLAEAGTGDDVMQRHARYVLAEVDRLSALLGGRAEIEGAAQLAELWPNLRAAFDWAVVTDDLDLATRLVGPIASQAFLRPGVGELSDWIERILDMADPADEVTIENGLLWAALHHAMTQDRDDFLRIVDRVGQPDRLLANFARAIVDDDDEPCILELAPSRSPRCRTAGTTRSPDCSRSSSAATCSAQDGCSKPRPA